MKKAKQFFDEVTEGIAAREQSTIERAKALDSDFRITVEGVERTYGEQLEAFLDLIVSNLKDRLTCGEEKITINETVSIANQIRKLLKDRAEAKQRDIVLPGTCPDKSTKQPCVRCPRCAAVAAMSDRELDREISKLTRHLNYHGRSGSPDN